MLLSRDVGYGQGSGSATITRDSNGPENLDTATTADSIPVHPHGVKPLGNQYFASGSTAREYLGPMARLPDEMILHMLEYLDTDSLRDIGFTCRFLYAFSQLDDLWKTLFLESFTQLGPSQDASTEIPSWRGSWRSTHLQTPLGRQARIDCSNVYSDVVHRPFVCAHIGLEKYATTIPKRNEISRLDSLTYDEFAQDWSNTPFILTQCIQTWPVCRDWSIQELGRKYSGVRFRAEAVDWPFSTYQDYMSNSDDESPLYLFDRGFAEKMDIVVGRGEGSVYSPPECFGPDLFEILHSERPAHRWLIVGPKRSGSTFHKDPNATSAWNAVIQGSKYWIMAPPTAQVPGVYVSKDSSEVTSPLSIAEWLLEFHAEARSMPGCIEGVCKAGEILHVPSGWWHLVVNLEAGIALTQNFVPKSHLANVLSFLKDKPDQVTGFKRSIECPYDLFIERLRDSYPELLDEALEEMDRKNRTKKRKWEEAIGSKDQTENGGGGSGFSFGFGFADEDGEIP